MKRNCLTWILTLLTAMLLAVPAFGAADARTVDGKTVGYVTDTAGILTTEEVQMLEQAAQSISEEHDFGVYVITVDSFRAFTDSNHADDGAVALYQKYGLGLGEERRGILLLLSMKDRDYSLVTYSDYGNYIFDASAREWVADYFLDDFAYDDWFSGLADYLYACDDFLLEGPARMRSDILARIGMILLIPLVIAAIAIAILNHKMKSVARAVEASAYAGEGLQLNRSYDRFTHSTESRRRRKEDSSGGSRSGSSGGFGRTSGKF